MSSAWLWEKLPLAKKLDLELKDEPISLAFLPRKQNKILFWGPSLSFQWALAGLTWISIPWAVLEHQWGHSSKLKGQDAPLKVSFREPEQSISQRRIKERDFQDEHQGIQVLEWSSVLVCAVLIVPAIVSSLLLVSLENEKIIIIESSGFRSFTIQKLMCGALC